MNFKKHTFTLSLILLIFSASFFSHAQKTYKMNGPTKFEVLGTSTLKDWEMDSEKGDGTAKISVKNGKISSIEDLNVSVRGKSLKSGSSGMDKNAHEALKVDKHPVIRFNMKDVLSYKSKSMRIRGDLTIAGVTRSKTFDVKVKNSDQSLVFYGDLDVTFSEFNMEPPTAMWGSIKTGNDLKLNFYTAFKPIQ